MRAPALAAILVALVATGCGDAESRSASENAGAWKTWVLPSPSSIEVPAPPEGSGAAKNAGGLDDPQQPAVKPWLDRAMRLVSGRPKDPVTSSRNYALVSVAMYDAAVAAAHWQRAHDRPDYPSTDAAIAAAGSRVVAYAFPEFPAAQLDADAQTAADRAVEAGATTRDGARAGTALGHEVAERVIARGREDGSDREWDGRRPRGREYWHPLPGSSALPVAPLAGTWDTWVLRSGSELRPPPPPKFGSPKFLREARELIAIGANLTPQEKRTAEFWAGGEGTELPAGRWIKVTLEYLRSQSPVSHERAARIFALLTVAMADAGVAAWDAKYAYWNPRPETAIADLGLARNWKPYLETPFFPAYVSGHSTYSGAAAQILGYLFPEDARLWKERAREASDSRLLGGIHWRSDAEEGFKLGTAIGKRVVARAKRDGANR